MGWAGNVERITENKFIQGLVGKPERKRLLGRRNSRREDNIKMHLGEIGWEAVD
jgi:hypothetical protein